MLESFISENTEQAPSFIDDAPPCLLLSRIQVLIREQAASVRPPADGNVSVGKTPPPSFFFLPSPGK